jgi:hypothetical protein
MVLRCSCERASKGQAGMVRDYLFSLCGGAFMLATWTGFGTYITPEPAEMKLARIRAGVDWSIPVRTLPPEVKARSCILMWIGAAGVEMWCPMPRRPEQAPPAVPTS